MEWSGIATIVICLLPVVAIAMFKFGQINRDNHHMKLKNDVGLQYDAMLRMKLLLQERLPQFTVKRTEELLEGSRTLSIVDVWYGSIQVAEIALDWTDQERGLKVTTAQAHKYFPIELENDGIICSLPPTQWANVADNLSILIALALPAIQKKELVPQASTGSPGGKASGTSF